MPFPRNRLRPARLASLASLATAAAFTFGPSQAQNVLPSHGVVTSGAASIGQSGANMTVNQTSSRAIVNWGSFSIGPANGVTFDQPSASSAILNRVTGSTTSTIAGQLQANGQVYLVNPNGIAITKTGAVQVGGGFVASTLGIADNDFNKGNLNFVGNGASAGVSNAGSITAAPGGFVGLLGGTVANSGVVSVPLGKVAMGSGEQATLNLTGDNFLQVAVPTNTKTADGQALIDVSGKVRAAGGSVELKAATVAQAIRNAVNVPGELSVTSARASGGSIILGGGPGGDVSVTGRLRASGRTAGGTIAITGHNLALRRAKLMASSAKGRGGSVTVTGTNAVSLVSSLVDASGATGGGAIRIGGDFHGASDLTSAQTTTIDKATTLNASATASGDGGTVAVWSDATTNFAGRITATGGPSGGDGGYVEVSANPATHGVLALLGICGPHRAEGQDGDAAARPVRHHDFWRSRFRRFIFGRRLHADRHLSDQYRHHRPSSERQMCRFDRIGGQPRNGCGEPHRLRAVHVGVRQFADAGGRQSHIDRGFDHRLGRGVVARADRRRRHHRNNCWVDRGADA